jgi:hypothetical protein
MFILSPSRIARYFFHQCERHLRYFVTPVNVPPRRYAPPLLDQGGEFLHFSDT